MHILNELTYINKSSLALGYFDGVHMGHSVVLKNTISIAQNYNIPSVVITFGVHPNNILTNSRTEKILTFDERLEMLEKTGIDYVVVLNFEDYKNINAKDYLENIIVKYFHPKAITTGYNHYFGYNREGDGNLIKEMSSKYGYEYYSVPPYVTDGIIVSSSQIRNKLRLGDIQGANNLLGYNYFISGIVEEGEKIASKLGYPSANIQYNEEKVKVPYGVYYVLVEVGDEIYNGVYNYGIVKNKSGEEKFKSEVHIIDFNKNIYSKKIKISFITKIRNQISFENEEKLKYQIQRDIAFTEIYKYFLKKTCSFM